MTIWKIIFISFSFSLKVFLLVKLILYVFPLIQRESSGLWELCAGGLVYMLGVVFFKSDGRIPCAHAIWHLFVNVGATLHFYAVHKYLINNEQQQEQTESWYIPLFRFDDVQTRRPAVEHCWSVLFSGIGRNVCIPKITWSATPPS